jgi:hypothetical protein
MTMEEFRLSLRGSAPPEHLPPLLQALWWEERNDFHRAHEIAQDDPTPDGAWVHAYLHRKEGDEGNAGYWYRRARRSHPSTPFDREWEEIAASLLGRLG